MIYEKPKNEIFASDAKDGEIVEFPNIKRGWGVTENLGFIPPMEYFNAAFNRVDKSLAYQLQRGVGEWDKDMEYPIGAVVSLNGIIYIAKSQNINKNPSENKEIWHVIASEEWCEQTFLKKDDKIDAYTKQESDDKFALKTDFEANKQETGYTKLPNGLIIQWGKIGRYPPGVTKIKETQLFPIAFPNKCLSITSQVQDHSINDHNASEEVQNRNIYVKINYTTKGGFIFAMHTPSGTEAFGWEFYWIAIGY